MMHAFIYIGGTQEKRLDAIAKAVDTWGIAPADRIEIRGLDEHIGIDDVRSLGARLQLSPISSPKTVGIIFDAWSLTAQAQQAILNLLEEPPTRSAIILETANPDELLPTIVSRCEIIRLVSTHQSGQVNDALETLLHGDAKSRITLIDAATTDRKQAKAWTAEVISSLRTYILTSYTQNVETTDAKRAVSLVRKLVKVQAQLAVNCNPKLALDGALIA